MAERLIFYSAHTRELVGTTESKIKAILDQHAIEYDKESKVFRCKPILQKDGTPYNKTTYELQSSKEYGFTCSCQGWRMKLKKHTADLINAPKPGCSHVAALYEYLKRQHIDTRQEKIYGGVQTIFGVD